MVVLLNIKKKLVSSIKQKTSDRVFKVSADVLLGSPDELCLSIEVDVTGLHVGD